MDDIVLEGPGSALDNAGPVPPGLAFVYQGSPLVHGRLVQGFDQGGKRFLDLGADAFDPRPIAGLVQPPLCQQFVEPLGRQPHPAGLVLVVRLRVIGDEIPIPADARFSALPLEIVVQRMEELVRQRPGPAGLGQIDDDFPGLVVRGELPAATGTKGHRQFTVEGQRPRRHANDVGQIGEGIECLVQHPLPLLAVGPLRHPISELHAPEAKRFGEHFRRHVPSLPVILGHAGPVGVPAHVGFLHVVGFLDGLPRGHQIIPAVLDERTGLLYSRFPGELL